MEAAEDPRDMRLRERKVCEVSTCVSNMYIYVCVCVYLDIDR